MLLLLSALKRATSETTQATRAGLLISMVLLILTIAGVIAIVISSVKPVDDPDGIQKAKAKLLLESGRFDPGAWDRKARSGL